MAFSRTFGTSVVLYDALLVSVFELILVLFHVLVDRFHVDDLSSAHVYLRLPLVSRLSIVFTVVAQCQTFIPFEPGSNDIGRCFSHVFGRVCSAGQGALDTW